MSHNNKAARIAKQIKEKFGDQVVVNVDRDYVWISGDTYHIKDILKRDYGARWGRKRQEWWINCTDKSKKSTNGKPAAASAKASTKKSKKPKTDENLLDFSVSWGTIVDEKSIVYGRVGIQAASIQKAKAIATRTVNDWISSETDDQRVKDRQESFRSSMSLTCKWDRIIKSEKTGLPFAMKRMGTWMGVLWFGEYILLKQVSE